MMSVGDVLWGLDNAPAGGVRESLSEALYLNGVSFSSTAVAFGSNKVCCWCSMRFLGLGDAWEKRERWRVSQAFRPIHRADDQQTPRPYYPL